MPNAPLTSIRSNSIPPGGVTALQAVPPEQVPAEIAALVAQMGSVIERFRQNSTDMSISLDTASFNAAGASKSIRITSVGLGYRVRSHHQVVFNISNSSGSAVTVNLSPDFPYNLVANTNVQINGGTSVYSASGKAGLLVYGRTRRGFFNPVNNGLNPALCRVTFGSGLTPTQSSTFTLSGYSSFQVAANTTNAPLTVDFYTFEKLAYSRDTLLGALPLQNNSVYAQLTRTLVGSFTGTDMTTPFYVPSTWPSSITVGLAQYNVDAKYDFWSVPNDPGLYAPMVNNSYQVQEQTNLTASSTGANALVYNFPQNQFLVAAHLVARDSTNTPLAWNALPKLQIMYNGGSVIPVVQDAGTTRAEQFSMYGADIMTIPGYRLFDGDATSEVITRTDEAGWLDCYNAATPQLVADIASTVSAPVTYNVTREIVVAGAVQVV